MYHSPIYKDLHLELLRQAEEAFGKPPDLSGVVHGCRRIIQGARGRRTALFPSRKNCVTIALESQLETPYCLLLERDSNVIGYRCQALEIEYSKGRFYFPDFLIRMRDGRWLVHEIKPSREHLSDETRECFDVAGVLLANCGFYFSLIDAMDLPRGSYLENLYFLYHRSISKLWSKQECEQALEHITTLSGACPLDELHTLLADAGLSPLLADHLLFHGFLIADLSRPLRLHTPVRLAL